MPDKLDGKFQPVETPRTFKPGEENGYQADTFSRNDREGQPPDAEGEPESDEKQPDPRRLKATDDPDSRDAPPPSPQGGGVR
ncbi:MAG TPA: hypothetical protein VFE13_05885 [Caulobacteraceae bacterium]|jgi:hypothetical protein|nr:hypothetical protein [Caulobacteraceae bacterium]